MARIPREKLPDHDVDERLTQKHIQTLGFLQEIVNENKALKLRVAELEECLEETKDMQDFAKESKEKIKEIQDSYMQKADEVNQMLAEKHRIEIMDLQNEKLELERELKEQILKMRHEIDSLNCANKDLRDTATNEENENEIKGKLKEVMKHAQAYRKDNEELRVELEDVKSDLEILKKKKTEDLNHIKDLRNENKRLNENVVEMQQKNNELELRLDRTLGELNDKSNDEEQKKLIEVLRDKIKQLTVDREAAVERETQMGQDILDLSVLKDELKQMNLHLQSELERLLAEYGQLTLEYEKLRKKSLKDKDHKSFKDFVSLKRELRSVKYENQALKGAQKQDIHVLRDDHQDLSDIPKRKQSLEGKRSGAKKLLAISMKPHEASKS